MLLTELSLTTFCKCKYISIKCLFAAFRIVIYTTLFYIAIISPKRHHYLSLKTDWTSLILIYSSKTFD